MEYHKDTWNVNLLAQKAGVAALADKEYIEKTRENTKKNIRDMYNLLDDGMVSHCCWKNNNEILAWAHKEKIGNQYYLLKDKTKEYKVMWKNELTSDGHPTYSPNGKYIITDSYADRKRMCHIFLMNTENTEVREIAKVFEPFKYDNDTRCDLHPRWDRKSKRICFDGVFEGKRALYTLKIEE